MSCISIRGGGHFEISIKSNSGQMREPRDAKFSHNMGLDTGTWCTWNGVAARWRCKKISNAIFSATATDIAAVLSLLRAPLGSLPSAPTSWGLRPPLRVKGGHVPTQNSCRRTLRFFKGTWNRVNFWMATAMGVLCTLKIAEGFNIQFLRKWGSKFLGAGYFHRVPYSWTLDTAFCRALLDVKMMLKFCRILLPVWSYGIVKYGRFYTV